MLIDYANAQTPNVVKDIVKSIGTIDGYKLIKYLDSLGIQIEDITYTHKDDTLLNFTLPKAAIKDLPSFKKEMAKLSDVGRFFEVTEKKDDGTISIKDARIFDESNSYEDFGKSDDNVTPEKEPKRSALDTLELSSALADLMEILKKISVPEEKKPELSSADFQKFLLQFPTVQSYCNEMMYGPAGYYSSGTVGVTEIKEQILHFTSNKWVHTLAAGFAYQIFYTYEKLRAAGVLKEDDLFHVLECGGGNGNLCFHILKIIETMATKDEKWAPLFKVVQYHLVECAEALVNAQKMHNIKYIKMNKVKVVPGTALDLSASLPEVKYGITISNELLDMLLPHMVVLKNERDLRVKQTLPFISEANLSTLCGGPKFLELKAASEKYKTIFKENSREDDDFLDKFASQILLSQDAFFELHLINDKSNKPSPFNFHEITLLAAQSVPKISEFLERDPQFMDRCQIGNPSFVETGSYDYLKGVQAALLPGGRSLNITYFKTDNQIKEKLIPCQPKHHFDIYKNPSKIDITHTVNSTKHVKDAIDLFGNSHLLSSML